MYSMTNYRIVLTLFLIGLGAIFVSSQPVYAQQADSGRAWLDSNRNSQADVGNVPEHVIPATQTDWPDKFYGIPLDPSSRLFLAVAGLLGGGAVAVVIGALGLGGTLIAIRRHRKRQAE